MNDLLEKIKQEMNLREPQSDSLDKFVDLLQSIDLVSLEQERIKRLLERGTLGFPDPYARFTFALATGVGKTKLMGAMMAWLYLSRKSRHFVMLAPSSTIYKKMQNEAISTHKKYI
ncbi:MAG: DEAD/DEAH box helicase family protein, partial [Candidatus Parcubacteria bacterium]|nr:DEAD/DEAH box helicase family protein [Candidatus Parcubacteria bacterium]